MSNIPDTRQYNSRIPSRFHPLPVNPYFCPLSRSPTQPRDRHNPQRASCTSERARARACVCVRVCVRVRAEFPLKYVIERVYY